MHPVTKMLAAALIVAIISPAFAAFAKEEDPLAPWSVSKKAPFIRDSSLPRKANPYVPKSSLAVPFLWMIKIYRFTSSSQVKCTFHPSCSEYARQAILVHGILLGAIMGVERIMRFHNDLNHYDLVKVGSGYRLSDPLDLNDFWFKERKNDEN